MVVIFLVGWGGGGGGGGGGQDGASNWKVKNFDIFNIIHKEQYASPIN